MEIYLVIAFFVALFSGDNGKLNATECVLFGLCWPVVLIGYLFIYGVLYVVSLYNSVFSYIKDYRYKMYVNKQIIDMVKKFNEKSE